MMLAQTDALLPLGALALKTLISLFLHLDQYCHATATASALQVWF